MGMGSYPCSGYRISHENLTKMLPEPTQKLSDALKKANLTFDDLARYYHLDDPDISLNDEIETTFEYLRYRFSQETLVNNQFLELSINYYNQDDGDRYDDLQDGCNWLVEGMEQLTEPGKKFKDIIEFAAWTIYG